MRRLHLEFGREARTPNLLAFVWCGDDVQVRFALGDLGNLGGLGDLT